MTSEASSVQHRQEIQVSPSEVPLQFSGARKVFHMAGTAIFTSVMVIAAALGEVSVSWSPFIPTS